jgi:hypothetical protein
VKNPIQTAVKCALPEVDISFHSCFCECVGKGTLIPVKGMESDGEELRKIKRKSHK